MYLIDMSIWRITMLVLRRRHADTTPLYPVNTQLPVSDELASRKRKGNGVMFNLFSLV